MPSTIRRSSDFSRSIPVFFLLIFAFTVVPRIAGAASNTVDMAVSPGSTVETSSPPKNYSGIYRGQAGTVLSLCHIEKSPQWIMTVTEPESKPLTMVLSGQESSLKPSGLNCTIDFGGQPMEIVASGQRLYARGTSDGKTIECLRDAGGSRTVLDGESSRGREASAGEIESSMALDEVAGRWNVMKQIEVSVGDDGLTLRNSLDARLPRKFTREKDLSNDETESMKQKLAAHARILDESESFVAREKKSEEQR
jgi:hypothetical protein